MYVLGKYLMARPSPFFFPLPARILARSRRLATQPNANFLQP